MANLKFINILPHVENGKQIFSLGYRQRFLKLFFVETAIGPTFRYVNSNQEGRPDLATRIRERDSYLGKPYHEGNIIAPTWRVNLRVGAFLGKVPGMPEKTVTPFRNGIVKFYPIGAFFNDFRVGYERPIGNNFSFSLMAGYHKRLWLDNDGSRISLRSRHCEKWLAVQGYTVKAGPRWYFEGNNSPSKGIYIEALGGYRSTRFEAYTVHMEGRCGSDQWWNAPIKRIAPQKHHVSLQGNLGYQGTLNSHLVLEVFGGMGLRQTWVDENQQDNLDPPDPNLDLDERVFLSVQAPYGFITPTFHGSIALGWGL